jgi:hypothetical protein
MSSTNTPSERARDLLKAYNAAKKNMMKEEEGDNAADMVADLLVRAGRSLLEAVKAGDIDECRVLLAIEGVDIHIKDSPGYPNWGWTPMLWACLKGRMDILEYLVSKGANIHDKNSHGWSCLMRACENGYMNIIEYLVSTSCLMCACIGTI